MVRIGNDWDGLLADEWYKPYYLKLREFLQSEYAGDAEIYPPASDIYNALRLTPYHEVKAVILGQDPYHEPGQAQGLAFSVPCDVDPPPSLVNIMKELASDPWQTTVPASVMAAHLAQSGGLSGRLVPWARQGVLLLNTVLTVRAHAAGSHRGQGWEIFTDRVIELLAERAEPMVFILWGANARSKKELILEHSAHRHLIIEAPHPSPLSAHRGFFGGRYFSRTNYFLADNGIEPIDWTIRNRQY